jgi:hypothetical protein
MELLKISAKLAIFRAFAKPMSYDSFAGFFEESSSQLQVR